jgi:ABC-type sugar transport system ATPase subunit
VDRILVLRDGEQVGNLPIDQASEDAVIRLMVGRQVELYPKQDTKRGPSVLDIQGLSDGQRIHDVSFSVCSGEIVGLAGLVGAGRTEVARMIFGVDRKTSGRILVDGQEVVIQRPQDAIRAGIGFVPEDRKTQGLILGMDVKSNFSLSILERISRLLGLINGQQERQLAHHYKDKLNIQTPRLEQIIRNLSGGNQQKVILARWMAMHPRLLILDEPTRGIDIGAKTEVHRLMTELAGRGMAILMISSELPEIIGMSDRVLVMCEGRIAGQLNRQQLLAADAQEVIIALAGAHSSSPITSSTPQ